MKKVCFIILLASILFSFPTLSLQEKNHEYSYIISECQRIVEVYGKSAGITYLQNQYEHHPEYNFLPFCLGALECQWDTSAFIYTLSDKACQYFEQAYSMDTNSPDHIWGEGLVAYKKQDYDRAINLMVDFLSYISIPSDTGYVSIDSSVGILSPVDQYITAVNIIIDCCARRDVPSDNQLIDCILNRTRPLLNPSHHDMKTLRHAMQVMYYGVVYAKQTGASELTYQYAQDYICLYDIIFRYVTLYSDSFDESGDLLDQIFNQLNEMYVLTHQCLDILEEYYFH